MAVIEPRDDADWEQFTQLTARSFGLAIDDAHRRIAAARPSAFARFEVSGDRVLAGAIAVPCHQYFGGRPVPAAALGTVCVTPDERMAGLGRKVVWSLADVLGREGIAVSPTPAIATRFLRNLGWETAGQSHAFDVPTEALRTDDTGSGTLRDPDPGDVRALRARVAPAWSGPIERPSWWTAMREGCDDVRVGWHDGQALRGYLGYRTRADEADPTRLHVVVSELWAETRMGLDAMLRVLASERTQCSRIRFDHGALPCDTAVRYRIDATLTPVGVREWMLRVVNPEAALAAAGWPTIAGRLDLEVAALGRPASVMSIDFHGGSATVTATDLARVRMSTGAFAAWFAGALPATQAGRLGIASGPAEDLAFMDLLVADRRPWLPDIL